ncbi:MAG: hypothetical protein SGCHY_004724, partial [Lobulomycetales sp.]
NLQTQELSGQLPETLGDLSMLRVLNLAGNSFDARIPDSISRLENLTLLILDDNELEGSLPFLGNMSHLAHLNVSNNRLGGSIPAELGGLSNLTSLDLSNNQFSGNLWAGISSLPKIQLFHAFGNDLSGEIPSNFSEWQVDSCDLSGNADLCKSATLNGSCFNDVKLCSELLDGPLVQQPSWTEVIDVPMLPADCFGGIGERCTGDLPSEQFTCSDADVSRLLVENTLLPQGLNDGAQKLLESGQVLASEAVYTSSCANGNEKEWTGTVEITGDFGIVQVYQTPSFTSVSFLSIASFSTSSVQYACVVENGEEVAFSSIVGGIVAGRQVTESQYNCRKFVVETVTLDSSSNVAPNSTTGGSDLLPEINSGSLLITEYVIVTAYILISYAAAIVALRRRRLQSSMSDFKVFLNTSFSAIFLVWGTGNLVYMVLFSLLLDESNFFLIKSVLTLTYFFTYYGFALTIHYRFHGLVNRTSPYNMVVDGALFLVTSLICFSYLSITLTVEYCNVPGYASGSICDSVSASRSLLDLYQANALILSIYGLIIDFVLGIIALSTFIHVPAVAKVLKELHGTRHHQRYSRRANRITSAWTFLLLVGIILVFVQRLTPTVYNDIHASAIINNVVQLLNTVQFWIAYELIRALEFLLRIGTGRKRIISHAPDDWDASDSCHPSSVSDSEKPSENDVISQANDRP